MRYKNETKEKSNGVIYTPKEMADFLSNELISYHTSDSGNEIYVLDPAVGNGELLLSIGSLLKKRFPNKKLVLVGYTVADFKSVDIFDSFAYLACGHAFGVQRYYLLLNA